MPTNKSSLRGYLEMAHFRPGRRAALGALLAGLMGLPLAGAQAKVAGEPVRVVATFSILGDMVREIGGEHVQVATIVGPNGDAHTFEPTPADVKALADAQVLVLNGLDFEAWLPRLIQSAGFRGQQVLASKGVSVRHLSPAEQAAHAHAHDDHAHDDHDHKAGHADHDHADHDHGIPISDVDPHAWQSLQNGLIYAQNIRDGLIKAAPEYRAYFKGRAKDYIDQMNKLDAEMRQALSGIPQNKRKVVSSHDAFGYFARDYGVEFISLAGLSNKAEPSAKEMAALVDTMKKEGVSGVFVESTANPRLAAQIARETGARLGGTLFSDALAAPGEPAASYLGMMSWNAGQLIYVLKGEEPKDGT